MRPEALLGRTIAGRFTITRFLGEGGMATVWVATQSAEPREIALKIMNEELTSDRSFVRRFEREAKAASRVVHPNSVKIFDYGVAAGLSYIAMELVRGDDLYVLLERHGSLGQRRAARILAEVCDALQVAHDMGIVHRDLKPENIMVVPDPTNASGERVKVLDFGIAKLIAADAVAAEAPVQSRADPASSVTRAGTFIGTPAYMSPEQCGLQAVDPRADLYTCGVLLFQLVTGRLPLEGETPLHTATLHLHQQPPPPTEIAPGIDPRLEAIIVKALAKRPQERHQTARHLGATLRKLLPDLPDTAVGLGPVPKERIASWKRTGAFAPASSSSPGGGPGSHRASTDAIESARTIVAAGTPGPPPSVVLRAEPHHPSSDPPTAVRRPEPVSQPSSSDPPTALREAPASSSSDPVSSTDPSQDSDASEQATLIRAPAPPNLDALRQDTEVLELPPPGARATSPAHRPAISIDASQLALLRDPRYEPPSDSMHDVPVLELPPLPDELSADGAADSGSAPDTPLVAERRAKPTLQSAQAFRGDARQPAPVTAKAAATAATPAPDVADGDGPRRRFLETIRMVDAPRRAPAGRAAPPILVAPESSPVPSSTAPSEPPVVAALPRTLMTATVKSAGPPASGAPSSASPSLAANRSTGDAARAEPSPNRASAPGPPPSSSGPTAQSPMAEPVKLVAPTATIRMSADPRGAAPDPRPAVVRTAPMLPEAAAVVAAQRTGVPQPATMAPPTPRSTDTRARSQLNHALVLGFLAGMAIMAVLAFVAFLLLRDRISP